jgi:hypothetical protein
MTGVSSPVVDVEAGVGAGAGVGNLTEDVDNSFDLHRERVYTEPKRDGTASTTAWLP